MSSNAEESGRQRRTRMANRAFSLPFSHELRNRRRSSSQNPLQYQPVHPIDISPRPASIHNGHQLDDTWPDGNEDIEQDVLFPQYDIDEKVDDQADMAAFDAMYDRKMSADADTLKLAKTTSRRTLGDQNSDLDPSSARFTIYTVGRDAANAEQFHELLSEEGRAVLENTLQSSSTTWWVDVLCPTLEDMKTLGKTFHIHPLTSEDVLAQEQREKIEIFPNYSFICFRSFHIDPYTDQIRPFNFYILIFRQGLLTFRFRVSDIPRKVRERTDQLRTYMTITPDWLNYAIIDAIVDDFAPTILQAEMEAVSIDELSLMLRRAEQSDMLKRISRCRRRSIQLSRLLTSKMDVIRSLMKRYQDWANIENEDLMDDMHQSPKDRKAFTDMLLYLGDIQDHVVTMVQNINHYNRILGRAHTNYLAQVNVELTKTYSITNMVMNRLTFLATVFIPLTVLCGLFGMNVDVPGKYITDTNYFFWICGGIAVYSVSMIMWGRSIKLL